MEESRKCTVNSKKKLAHELISLIRYFLARSADVETLQLANRIMIVHAT